MYLILRDDGDAIRGSGHATVKYSSTSDKETVVETTEEELSKIFEDATVAELTGADAPIEAAVDEPLRYCDYLILDDDVIVFDEDYERSEEE